MKFTFDLKRLGHEEGTKWYGFLTVHGPERSLLVNVWGPFGRITGTKASATPRGIIIDLLDKGLRHRQSRGYKDRLPDLKAEVAVFVGDNYMSALSGANPDLALQVAEIILKCPDLHTWMLAQMALPGAKKKDAPFSAPRELEPGETAVLKGGATVIKAKPPAPPPLSVALTQMDGFGDW